MSETTEEKKSLYQRVLAKGKEAFKGLNDIVTTKRDKRAFKSAYDNALEKRDKAKQDRLELYEKVGKYSENMEKVVQTCVEERQANITMEVLKEQYMELFESPIPETE